MAKLSTLAGAAALLAAVVPAAAQEWPTRPISMIVPYAAGGDSPAVSERYIRLGNTVAAPPQRSPAYLGGFIRSEIDKWAGPIRASGVSME